MLWLTRFTFLNSMRRRVALALPLIAAVACSDRDTTAPEHAATPAASANINASPFAAPPLPPSITVSPSYVTFGPQAIGTSSAAQVVTVRNTGTATVQLGAIGAIVVHGPFAQTNDCPGTLGPNQFCSIWVVYAATAAGAQSGYMAIPSNAPNTPAWVTLDGTGFVPVPAISITPASIGFGSVPLGTATSGRVVKITSTGSGPLVISSLTLGGTNPGDFSLNVDGCTGASLNPGASCTAYVSFEPAAAGTRTATLTIAHNASGGSAAVSLAGAGVRRGGYIP